MFWVCAVCGSVNVNCAESNNSYGCSISCFDCGTFHGYPSAHISVYTEDGWDLPFDFGRHELILASHRRKLLRSKKWIEGDIRYKNTYYIEGIKRFEEET